MRIVLFMYTALATADPQSALMVSDTSVPEHLQAAGELYRHVVKSGGETFTYGRARFKIGATSGNRPILIVHFSPKKGWYMRGFETEVVSPAARVLALESKQTFLSRALYEEVVSCAHAVLVAKQDCALPELFDR